MVDPEKVHGLLRNLEKALEQLHVIAQYNREEFLADPIRIGAAKYYLQTAIEACIDIGNHLISSERYRAPEDYRDIFNVLEENNVITVELGVELRQMVGLRNRLVHLYWEIDDEKIFEYIQVKLGDFNLYIHRILEYIKLLK